MHKLLSIANAKKQRQAVENPDYSAKPVSTVQFGLAPKAVISNQHDPSLGYRTPLQTNVKDIDFKR